MKMHTLSKKTLAIFLSLAMLMSCMVWSGVSAATEYFCNFTNYGITGTSDIDKAHGSTATVVDTGEADYGSAVRLEYKTGATGTKAGFRFFGNTTGGSDVTSSNGKVQYNSGSAMGYFLVEFEYKVLTVAGNVDLIAACGSFAWTGDAFNAVGSQEVIETLSGTTEWKTARAAVHSNTTQNSAVHIFLQSATPADAVGTAVLVDNVRVIKDYVVPAAVLDYGYDSKTETLTGATGNAVPFPTPVRDGYVFQGWYDAAESGNRVTEATFGASGTSTTYYAYWTESESKSTIQFDMGAAPAIDPIEGEAGVAATLPTPTYDTYAFGGWYEDAGLTQATDGLYPAVGEVKTLYAKWTKIDYLAIKCDFDTQPKNSSGGNAGYTPTNTGNDNNDANKDVNYVLEGGEGYMKLTPQGDEVRTSGFRVFGNEWHTTINGTKVLGDTDNSRALQGMPYRITFKYKVVALDVNVSLNVHTADGALNSDIYAEANEALLVASKALTPADVSDEWATFEWAAFTALDTAAFRVGVNPGGNKSTTGIEILVDDIVIQWMPNARYTTVTYDHNDGTGTTETVKLVTDDPLKTLPYILGARHVGWADAAESGNPVTTVPVNDTTLYAQWTPDASITSVSFETNGGNVITDVAGVAGTAVTLPTPIKGVYKFGGWYLDENFETKATNVTFPEEGTLTLYAKWNEPDPSSAYIYPSGLIGTMDFETGEAADYMCQTVSTGKMEISDVQAHTGKKSFLHVFKSGDNAQRGRPRIALTLGDATKKDALQVKAGENYTISFWIRSDRQLNKFTFYAATMGASDFGTMIDKTNSSGGDVHTLQTLDYYAVGSDKINAAFNNKEPANLVLQAEQWTRVVMHIPSIVLDDANDVNYLTIGYTASDFTPGDNAPNCNVYIDDVAVYGDIDVKGTSLGSQSFETGTIDNFDDSARYSMQVSTDTAHTGSASLKATLSGNCGGQRPRPRLVLKNGDATTATNFVVEEGKSYTVSFWVKSSIDTGVFTYYFATMGSTDVSSMIATDASGCHTLQTLSYSSAGNPMKNGGNSAWGTAVEANNIQLTANRWTQIVATIPAITLDEADVANYLALGYTCGYFDGNNKIVDLYVDDIEIYDGNITDGDEMLDNITSAYQYVAGGDQDGNVVGETTPGSAIYVQDGVQKTAFRVAAKYTAGDAINKVIINGQSYEIVERGMLLGYANTLNGADLTLETTKDGGLAGKASTVTPTNYWDENSGTNRVTYTILVRGVTKELKDVEFVSRAYMIILVNGKETVVYSDMSATFSAQSIYNASGSTATWFS